MAGPIEQPKTVCLDTSDGTQQLSARGQDSSTIPPEGPPELPEMSLCHSLLTGPYVVDVPPPPYDVSAPPPNYGMVTDPFPPPIVAQPDSGSVDFVGVGPIVSNEFYERGPMDHLKSVEELRIKQDLTVNADDLLTTSSSNTITKFYVVDKRAQLMYTAHAESFFVCDRSFNVRIRDSTGKDVIVLRRPFRCCGCCVPCLCLQEMTVESPPGWHMGSVQENWSVLTPSFTVRDYQDKPVFTITTRCCPGAVICYSGQDINYYVHDSRTAEQVGWIRKRWNGNATNQQRDPRHTPNAVNAFGEQQLTVSFFVQLPVQHKALLLSLALLLDFMFYEKTHIRQEQSIRY